MSEQSNPNPNAKPTGAIANLVLASASPRRHQLLQSLGLTFQVQPADLDEEALLATFVRQMIESTGAPPSPKAQVCYLSEQKALAVAQQYTGDSPCWIVASDTAVVIEEDVLGKPENRDHAFALLQRIQGQVHTVWSAITLLQWDAVTQKPLVLQTDAAATLVWMKPMTEAETWRYIDSGEPMDKAGAYAIQGLGGMLVHRIEGCYFNVMGFSLSLFQEMCKNHGLTLL